MGNCECNNIGIPRTIAYRDFLIERHGYRTTSQALESNFLINSSSKLIIRESPNVEIGTTSDSIAHTLVSNSMNEGLVQSNA